MESHYQWQQPPKTATKTVQQLAEATHLSPVVAQLLIERGIKTADQASEFLHPGMGQLVDPFQLHDMQKAVDRLEKSIANGEQITIYGDYDADGITSTALMYEGLQGIGAQVDYYVPDRFKDGYGPNLAAYKRLIDNGTQLIVTVDNGVTGKAEVAYARSRGVDVVITDHHELPDELPTASAIVHPHFPGAEYQAADLSGVGVAFKVIWALTEDFPADSLDLVAIGELADCVDVTGENRALIAMGLTQLRQGSRAGLHALVKTAGLDEAQLTDTDVGFGIAPRLNALGRIADANDGVRLLTTLDSDEADQLAKQVEDANQHRKSLVAEIADQAMAIAIDSTNAALPALLIVGHGWHQGVLGIVASRILEATGKPTIVASVNDDDQVAKGSGRAPAGYDLFQALNPHRELMTAFGGHPQACGLSFEPSQAGDLRQVLVDAAKAQGFNGQQKRPLAVGAKLTPDEVNEELYRQVQQLGPFGPGNEKPVFEFDNVEPTMVKTMGTAGQHLKFNLGNVTVVAFNHGQWAPLLTGNGGQVKIAATIGINEWRGKRTVQLMLEDLAIEGTVVVDSRTSNLVPALFQMPGYYLVYSARLRKNLTGHIDTAKLLTPQQAISTDFSGRMLTIVDCPPTLASLDKILTSGQLPAAVRLLLYEKHSAYLAGMPDRNDFKTLYRFTATHRNVDVRHRFKQLANYLHLNVDRLIFMLKLFSDVGFVTIKDGVLNPQQTTSQVNLKTAPRYQQQEARLAAEKQLIYSDSATVTGWIQQSLSED